ncbi:aminodeoxychorismate synthase component I [Marinoscillum sp.]|uniref:aminodeoxychorismate synthase component I n=1 Tax=Marinoscillum sp. TaxID=2024838 RepID=UPI003BAAB6C6
MLDREKAIERMNELGARRIPFFFFTDFMGSRCLIQPLGEINPSELRFALNQPGPKNQTAPSFHFKKHPLTQEQFHGPFRYVVDQINYGNSYLVNLTFRTPIETNLSLADIYELSQARYKLLYKDQFVVFSPETFVKMVDGHIYSYPMKGTIDASIADAETQILNDPKETAEHVTIVDLIRNDLSQIASEVSVSRFRFITEVKTHEKKLLQVSSEITGKLPANYHQSLGSMLFRLLPAGSISGAPKKETIHIIKTAETYDRGFYTGVCGLFDGQDLDTGVMIRFIEKEGDQLYYKSGGGITSFSDEAREYQEIIDKIYLPF